MKAKQKQVDANTDMATAQHRKAQYTQNVARASRILNFCTYSIVPARVCGMLA